MLKSLLGDFNQDARGAIAIIFSLTLVVIATTIGLAIDVSRGVRAGVSVGAAVDAAVLVTVASRLPTTASMNVPTPATRTRKISRLAPRCSSHPQPQSEPPNAETSER